MELNSASSSNAASNVTQGMSVKVKQLTDAKRINDNYHCTVITENARIARLIVTEKFDKMLKIGSFMKLMFVRYSCGIDMDYIRTEITTKIFHCTQGFVVDQTVLDGFFRPAFVDIDTLQTSPAKKRISVHGKVIHMGQTQQGPSQVRRSLVLSNDLGNVITATMFGKAVDDSSEVKVGTTVSIVNVETSLYNEKITVKSTDETQIEIQQIDTKKTKICVEGFYLEGDHYIIVDGNNFYSMKSTLFTQLKAAREINATIVNSEIVDYDVLTETHTANRVA